MTMKQMSFLRTKGVFLVAIGLVSSVLLTGCLKDDNNDNNVDNAGLMAFNLVPDRSSLAVRLSGNSLTNVPLAYNNFTGVYLGVFPGSRSVEVFDANGQLTTTAAYTFEANRFYSLFVAGANGSYRNIITEDNFDDLSASGTAYVRYINAIPDSARPTVTITANGSAVVTEQPAFGTVSGFTAVAPGSVTIDLNNGTTIDADRTITLESRKVYTILLTGIPGSAATPVEIKYVENGIVDENTSGRIAAEGASQKSAN